MSSEVDRSRQTEIKRVDPFATEDTWITKAEAGRIYGCAVGTISGFIASGRVDGCRG
jgi:hypothetical protein